MIYTAILFFFFVFFLSAYQNNDIDEFEKILQRNKQNIMEDPFIREHIEGTCISAHFNRYKVALKTFFISHSLLFSLFPLMLCTKQP